MPRYRVALLVALGLLPLSAQAAVTVEKPWMRYLLPNLPAAGYMVLHNSGQEDAVLVKASSPDCGTLMLHKSQDESGMAMMMDEASITIPANGGVTFAPGGYHLMCMQPKMKVGDRVPVTLVLKDGESLHVVMPVYGAQSAP